MNRFQPPITPSAGPLAIQIAPDAELSRPGELGLTADVNPRAVRSWFDGLAAAERPHNDGSLAAAHEMGVTDDLRKIVR